MPDNFVAQNSAKNNEAELNNLNRNKKLLAIVSLVILFTVSILIGRTLARKTVQNEPVPAVPSEPEITTQQQNAIEKPTTLNIVSKLTDLKVGTPQKISVELKGREVTAIDVTLDFNPDVFNVSDVVNGRVFNRILVNKIENGKLYYSASVSPDSLNNLNTGEIFSFTVTPKTSASTSTISFDKSETITALNGENTLGDTNNATFNIAAQ